MIINEQQSKETPIDQKQAQEEHKPKIDNPDPIRHESEGNDPFEKSYDNIKKMDVTGENITAFQEELAAEEKKLKKLRDEKNKSVEIFKEVFGKFDEKNLIQFNEEERAIIDRIYELKGKIEKIEIDMKKKNEDAPINLERVA